MYTFVYIYIHLFYNFKYFQTNKKAVTMSFNETVAHCKKLMSIVATQTIPCI